MPKPIKRGDLNRPLTCAEFDENIDRLLDRANHTGTQPCNSIYDLELCVRNFQYIKDLIQCCADLTTEINQLKIEIYDTSGAVYQAINNLRTELMNLINVINDKIIDIEAILVTVNNRLEALETCCSSLTAAYNTLNTRVTVLEGKVDEVSPVGIIVMWSGGINAIPGKYKLCDGTNGTPDLRDRFIIGAGGTRTVGATGGSFTTTFSINSTTGATSVPAGGLYTDGTSINENQMPPHVHTPVNTLLYPGGSEYPIYTGGSGGKKGSNPQLVGYVSTIGYTAKGLGAPHAHNVLGSTAAHTHTISIPTQTLNITNPFYALAFIMRVS
jgi:hypothetical protein